MASQIPGTHPVLYKSVKLHCKVNKFGEKIIPGMTFEFHKGDNGTIATKNFCNVYPSELNVGKCQRWPKFKSNNFDLSGSY